MDFLGNILAVHLVQDILERGNIVVNTEEEADKFVAGIANIRERMGYGK